VFDRSPTISSGDHGGPQAPLGEQSGDQPE